MYYLDDNGNRVYTLEVKYHINILRRKNAFTDTFSPGKIEKIFDLAIIVVERLSKITNKHACLYRGSTKDASGLANSVDPDQTDLGLHYLPKDHYGN